MHIRKQRLLTPGPTPLYPPALHAMMASDIHHRTEDFRVLYRETLADLKQVLGTSNDVLILVASGTGAMEASVSNLFSRGEKVIVCYAGKFGERWLEITKAFGLNAIPSEGRIRRRGYAGTSRRGAAGRPGRQGRFHPGFGNLDRRRAQHPGHGRRSSPRPRRSSSSTPSPVWAPCRWTSTAGAWTS